MGFVVVASPLVVEVVAKLESKRFVGLVVIVAAAPVKRSENTSKSSELYISFSITMHLTISMLNRLALVK